MALGFCCCCCRIIAGAYSLHFLLTRPAILPNVRGTGTSACEAWESREAHGRIVEIAGVSYFVHTDQEDWVCEKKS